jgi:hypothetical protein
MDDDDDDDDDPRSQATFSYTVHAFSKSKESQLCRSSYVHILPWKMMMTRTNQTQRSQAFFLQVRVTVYQNST